MHCTSERSEPPSSATPPHAIHQNLDTHPIRTRSHIRIWTPTEFAAESHIRIWTPTEFAAESHHASESGHPPNSQQNRTPESGHPPNSQQNPIRIWTPTQIRSLGAARIPGHCICMKCNWLEAASRGEEALAGPAARRLFSLIHCLLLSIGGMWADLRGVGHGHEACPLQNPAISQRRITDRNLI
jgi:hypothetical protein